MARHIKEFHIEHFRGIQDLTFTNLNDINILTGDNNAGKTSVLENINLLNGVSDLRNLIHGTRKAMSHIAMKDISEFDKLSYLFCVNEESGHEISFAFTLHDEKHEVRIHKTDTIETFTASYLKEFCYRNAMFLPSDMQEQPDDVMYDVRAMTLTFTIDQKQVSEKTFYELSRSEYTNEEEGKFIDTTYISPVRHAESAAYLSQIFDSPALYEDMLCILKEFDKGIISINADRLSEYSSRTSYTILSKEHNRAIPLEYYGDGMKKAVLLMSAVIHAKDGILLLDEFETAIHTTAMNHVFAWILRTCMKYHVQLFLTSHSIEAIDKVLKCCPDLADHINLYTLYKKDKQTLVRTLSCVEAIEANDALGLELR